MCVLFDVSLRLFTSRDLARYKTTATRLSPRWQKWITSLAVSRHLRSKRRECSTVFAGCNNYDGFWNWPI